MRNAPSVSFPVGRSPFEGRLLLGLGLAGGGALGLWRWQTAAPDVLAACLLGAWLAGCVLAWRQWRASPAGWLLWRDGAWAFRAGDAGADDALPLVRVRVALDFQSVLLLQLIPSGPGPRWLWLARGDGPAHWNALRRAVHGRPGHPDTRGPAAAGEGVRA